MRACLHAFVKNKTLIVISLILVYIIEKIHMPLKRHLYLLIADLALSKKGIFPPQKKLKGFVFPLTRLTVEIAMGMSR